MLIRIFGRPNSGKSFYSLKRLLEYESDICVISFEMTEDFFLKRIKKYIDNYSIDNDFISTKDIFSNFFIKRFVNSDIKIIREFILKSKEEKSIKTFLIDGFNIKSQFPNLSDFYQNLYNITIENKVDIIICDYQRDSLSESRINNFFEIKKLENIEVDRDDPMLLKIKSEFFGRGLDEIRDKKLDFILNK
jgi:hypothetical protein